MSSINFHFEGKKKRRERKNEKVQKLTRGLASERVITNNNKRTTKSEIELKLRSFIPLRSLLAVSEAVISTLQPQGMALFFFQKFPGNVLPCPLFKFRTKWKYKKNEINRL
jgi:hypothetical protein